MVIPVVEVHLHEAHAPFDEPTRQERGVGEGTGLAGLISVKLVRRVRLLGHGRQLRHAGLHAEGHLELLDAGVRLRVAHFAMGEFIQAAQAIELRAAKRIGDARWVVDEKNGIASTAEGHTGVFARQVTTGPQSRRNGLNLLFVGGFGHQHHEGREVFIEAPQAITHP